MIQAVLMMGGLGIIIGSALAVASKIFYVYVDPLIVAIDDVLPGANCGGCGYPGCSANAEAMAKGESSADSCVAGGPDLANAIAEIMGVKIEAKEPDIALPGCKYGTSQAEIKYIYDGLNDCRAAALLSGGMKECNIGCLGLGTCAKACPFDAIVMSDQGLPVVDEEKCTGCGSCERACPKNIINLSSITRRIIKEYTTEDCTTPCQRACPAGINISKYVKLIAQGNYQESIQVIKERNPFPTVIGRICPRPCEDDCRRKLIDEPVAINFLKRFAADFEKENNQRILPYKAPGTGRKIAAVGGGVEGLSFAFFAARLGYEPTIFESSSKLGGLLRAAISKNRLPMEILDWDIQGILEMGVKAETKKTAGKDFTIASLIEQNFEAVFLASGGWDSRLLGNKDSYKDTIIPSTYLLFDFLKYAPDNKIKAESNTVIIGGGKNAIDVAIMCKKQGVTNITIIYRENKENSYIEDYDINKLENTGASVIFNAGVSKIFGEDDKLTQLEYTEFLNNAKHKVQCNTIIVASGRFPELIFCKSTNEADEKSDKTYWEGVQPYKLPKFHNEIGLISKGDSLSDFNAAIKAISAGRRGVVSTHKILNSIDFDLDSKTITENLLLQNVYHIDDVKQIPRNIMPLSDIKKFPDKELEIGFSEETAKNEAKRCLDCGLICYQKNKSETIH